MNAIDVMATIRASDKPFYAYILRKPCGAPFYVGVGKGDRLLDHERDARLPHKRGRKISTIRAIHADGLSVRYEAASFHSDWHSAAAEEVALIRQIGRKDRGIGPLCNLTDGGEGAPGAVRSQAARDAVSAAQKGKVLSPETRQLLREANLGKKQSAEAIEKRLIHLRGKKRPPDVAKKVAAARALAGYGHSPEARAKMSASLKGKNTGTRSAEWRANIAASMVGRAYSDEARAKMKIAAGIRGERRKGIPLPHHPNRTPEGRAKHRRPVEINGIVYGGTDLAAEALDVGRTTIKRWLKAGTHGARRL